jgi:hypothetical protein
VYEITISGTPPAGLTARLPSITVQQVPTATILSRRVVDPEEVDELIERLRSLGITPLEVHASSGAFEFRIEGRLSESTLHSMRWAVRLEQGRSVVRVCATQDELRLILSALASNGLQIEHIIRRPAA